MTTTTEELKPCPFCGDAVSVYEEEGYIACNGNKRGCGFTYDISFYAKREEWINFWNTRHPQEPVKPSVEEVKEILGINPLYKTVKELESKLSDREDTIDQIGDQVADINTELGRLEDELKEALYRLHHEEKRHKKTIEEYKDLRDIRESERIDYQKKIAELEKRLDRKLDNEENYGGRRIKQLELENEKLREALERITLMNIGKDPSEAACQMQSISGEAITP